MSKKVKFIFKDEKLVEQKPEDPKLEFSGELEGEPEDYELDAEWAAYMNSVGTLGTLKKK